MIFVILKWVLWILLALLCILIYLCLAPLRIRGKFKVTDHEKMARLKLHSFSSFLRIQVKYQSESEEDFSWGIYLFWGFLQILPKKKSSKSKKVLDHEPGKGNKVSDNKTSDQNKDLNQETKETSSSDDRTSDQNKNLNQETRETASSDNRTGDQNKNLNQETRETASSDRNKLADIRSKMKTLSSTYGKNALKEILRQVLWLIKRFHLHFVRTKVEFSMPSPDQTGMVVGVISQFPFSYEKGLDIYPDFSSDQGYFRGHGSLKGHIIILDIIIVVVKLLLHKDVRRLIHSFSGGKN